MSKQEMGREQKEVYMNSQENDNLSCQLIEQIERQSEIIAYLLGKNEQLRSRLSDIERPAKGGCSAGCLCARALRVNPVGILDLDLT